MTTEFKDLIQLLQQQQMAQLCARLKTPTETSMASQQAASIPSFAAFDSSVDLWKDYWAIFNTFSKTSSVSKQQIFLTHQRADTYKLLSTLGFQQTPPKSTDDLTMEEIKNFMNTLSNQKHYIVRERSCFWSSLQHKPGEII